MKDRKVLCIIPARGGSKGIPGKNIKPVGGIPLVVYSIWHAQQSQHIDRIVVSTDADDIAEVSRNAGAEVIRRPAELSGDTASSESALQHVLDTLREKDSYEPELVVFLQPTSPVRKRDDIDAAMKTFEEYEGDSLLSVSPIHGFIWRATGQEAAPLNYDFHNRPRRQDAPKDVIENGSLYIFKTQLFRDTGNRLGGRMLYHEQDLLESFQIDTPDDLALIEMILQHYPQYKPQPDWTQVKLAVFDFDGVFTDNKVIVHQSKDEAVVCHRGDGWGIKKLREAGIPAFILSTEVNPVVAARAEKLQLTCYHGCEDKLTLLKQLVEERSILPAHILYMGNDENDLECLQWVGYPVAPADAEDAVKRAALFITRKDGGQGAVREVVERVLAQR